MLMIAFSDNTAALSCPTGWLQSGTTSTSTGAKAYFESCYKFKTTDTSVSLTPPSTNVSDGWTAEVAAFANVNGSTPLDGVTPVLSVSSVGSTTFTPTGVTTNSAGDLAVSMVMENDATNASIPTLNFTGTGGNAQSFTGVASAGVSSSASNAEAIAYQEIDTPGAVTFPTWTTSKAISGINGSIWLGISIALGSS